MAESKNFVVKNGLEVGTNVIVADATDLHVGLGTTAPLQTLDVRGDVSFSDGSTTNFFDVAGISTFRKDVNIGVAGTAFHVDVDTGRVGINSAIPRYKFDVRAGAGDTLAASFDNDVFAPNISITGGGAFANLEVTGITTTGDLYVSGVSTVGTAATMYGTFAVSSLTDNRIPIIGAGSTIEDDANLTFDGSRLAIGNGLSVGGISTFTGNIDANGDLDVDGHTELDDVNVSGASTFTGAADFNGAVDIDGHTELDDVNVSGVSTFNNNVSVGGGNLTVDGNIDLNGDIDVDGHTELDNLNVAGFSTFAGFATFSNDVQVAGVVTATSFSGLGQIGVGSEGTFIGVGVTMVDFKSTNSSNTVDIASGIATVTVTTGVSLGLVIALGS